MRLRLIPPTAQFRSPEEHSESGANLHTAEVNGAGKSSLLMGLSSIFGELFDAGGNKAMYLALNRYDTKLAKSLDNPEKQG